MKLGQRRLWIARAAGFLAIGVGPASAKEVGEKGIDIIPFGGYRWGGNLTSISGVKTLDTKDAFSFGLAVDKRALENSAIELYWGHFSGDVDVELDNGSTRSGGPVSRDDFMLNGLWYAYRPEPKTLPYVTAGVGASVFSSDATETIGRFGWNLGLGVRHELNDKVGMRVEGRWVATYFTTGTDIWCDPFACYPVSDDELYDHFEVSLGLIFKP